MDKNSRILITGSTGLVGYSLYKRLLGMGYDNLKCVVHNRQKDIQKEHIINGDLTSEQFCQEATKDIDYVFHVAAFSSGAEVIQNTPLVHITPNILMNMYILESSYNNGVKKVLTLSSSTSYPETIQAVTEDMLFDGHPYKKYFAAGWTKRYMETLCQLYSCYVPGRKMPCVVLRPTNIYGPHDKFDLKLSHVLPAMIVKMVGRQNPLEIWGTGNDIRDFIYTEDMTDAILYFMDKIDTYDPINIGYGLTYTVNNIINIICQLENFHPEKIYKKDAPTMIPCRRVSIEKAKKLGWEPKTRIRTGLRKTINWYKENYS